MSTSKNGHRDLWGRRDSLVAGGWLAIGASMLAGCGSFLRLLFRRAPVRPSTVFRAGRPGDYAPGSVSERFLRSWRVFMVNDGRRLYAIYAKCTHLGCTPRWHRAERRFKCPCHGSGFHMDGVNFEGPAPKPLYRLKIRLDRDGELVVDTGTRFSRESWDGPGAFIDLGAGAEGSA